MYQTNMLKLPLIFLIFTFIGLTSLGQQQFGIKVSGGLSRITNSMDVPEVILTIPFVTSGQAGLFYSFQLGKKSSLGAELLFSQIEGKEKLEIDYNYSGYYGSESGHGENIDYRYISYLSFPVYYGFKFNKLTINAGFQISCALLSSGREKNYAILNGITYSSDNKTDDINIKRFDYGPNAGIIYNLTDKLAFEGTYYYGLNNIQKGNPILGERKIQQVTIGIRYSLWYKDAKDGNKIETD